MINYVPHFTPITPLSLKAGSCDYMIFCHPIETATTVTKIVQLCALIVTYCVAGPYHVAAASWRLTNALSSQTVAAGGEARFAVEYESSNAAMALWYHEGIPIPNATLPEHVIADVNPEDIGRYSVVISADGKSLTNSAILDLQFSYPDFRIDESLAFPPPPEPSEWPKLLAAGFFPDGRGLYCKWIFLSLGGTADFYRWFEGVSLPDTKHWSTKTDFGKYNYRVFMGPTVRGNIRVGIPVTDSGYAFGTNMTSGS